nr:tRNA glutamyl-Q(34) synthetase GluQRS [Halorhodospira abdelmalekii]
MVAALGSYLIIKRAGGEWHVRIDDLDTPRCVPGAAESILRALEQIGLHWDGPVVYQSDRAAAYQAALATLEARGALYPCACTRKEVARAAQRSGGAGLIYPGTCRNGLPPGRQGRALRVSTVGSAITLNDGAAGRIECRLNEEIGDFIVRRSDGLFAYHLACVVDDAEAGFSHIIRGRDLLACTPPQIHLQRLLDLPQPRYHHLPLALNAAGKKLSKQTHAPPIDPQHPVPAMVQALQLLGLDPPVTLTRTATSAGLIAWGLQALADAPMLTLGNGPSEDRPQHAWEP